MGGEPGPPPQPLPTPRFEASGRAPGDGFLAAANGEAGPREGNLPLSPPSPLSGDPQTSKSRRSTGEDLTPPDLAAFSGFSLKKKSASPNELANFGGCFGRGQSGRVASSPSLPFPGASSLGTTPGPSERSRVGSGGGERVRSFVRSGLALSALVRLARSLARSFSIQSGKPRRIPRVKKREAPAPDRPRIRR